MSSGGTKAWPSPAARAEGRLCARRRRPSPMSGALTRSRLEATISTESSHPMAEKGTMVALKRAAILTNSASSGQNSWYSSPFSLYASRTPPGNSITTSPSRSSEYMLAPGATGTAPYSANSPGSCPPAAPPPSPSPSPSPLPLPLLLLGNSAGWARPRTRVRRCSRNSETMRPRSAPIVWWLPTSSTGPPPRGTRPSPAATPPSQPVE
mmetsp:Transcript_5432/g.15299  ORF Transcript_5432/g.15299 Transcript_5432/m.15299 type:complete len:209 (+) Transcript_5432:227-853(+)